MGRGFTAEANRVLYLITLSDLADYPWSSYRFNALGQANGLVTPHFEWQRLGSEDSQRQATYRTLFKYALSEAQINGIREATNNAWVLGEGLFKERIKLQLARLVEAAARGGDRKSAQFKINRN